MKPRHRRRLRIAGLRAPRTVRRYYVSLVSASVLAFAGAVALTSASFELPDTVDGSLAEPAPASALVVSTAAVSRDTGGLVARPARQVIVYIVAERAQGDRLILTHNGLVWDNLIADEYQGTIVRYLLADTPQNEANAIRELNYFIELAELHDDDLRIIDLRQGRGLAANAGLP